MTEWERLGQRLDRWREPLARAINRRMDEQKNGQLQASIRWLRHSVMGANLTQPEEIEPETHAEIS